jgi:hypothetical protein
MILKTLLDFEGEEVCCILNSSQATLGEKVFIAQELTLHSS